METAAPAPIAPQNTSFSPALKRRAGACFDLMTPPPCLNLNEGPQDQHDPQYEREARDIMCVFGGPRERAEGIRSQGRALMVLRFLFRSCADRPKFRLRPRQWRGGVRAGGRNVNGDVREGVPSSTTAARWSQPLG
jgi:hypothetical protein